MYVGAVVGDVYQSIVVFAVDVGILPGEGASVELAHGEVPVLAFKVANVQGR